MVKAYGALEILLEPPALPVLIVLIASMLIIGFDTPIAEINVSRLILYNVIIYTLATLVLELLKKTNLVEKKK